MNKANQIKDERLGVNDNHLSLEEKMLQRFALEKKKKHEKLAQFKYDFKFWLSILYVSYTCFIW